MSVQSLNDQAYVSGNDVRAGTFFQIVGAHQHDDGFRLQRKHIVSQPNQHATGGVAADTAVRRQQLGKLVAKIVSPSLRDAVAKKNHGALLTRRLLRKCRSSFPPEIAEPVISPNGAGPRQSFICRR